MTYTKEERDEEMQIEQIEDAKKEDEESFNCQDGGNKLEEWI